MTTKIEIVKAVTYQTYGVNAMGLGLVSLMDSRKEQNIDGESLFVHRLSEEIPYQDMTDLQRQQIKADCDTLVNLLKKFYHESEFVEIKA
jgi:hypothetical protein